MIYHCKMNKTERLLSLLGGCTFMWFISFSRSLEIRSCDFSKHHQYENFIASNNILWSGNVQSLFDCSKTCLETLLCRSYFYKKSTNFCQLQFERISGFGQLTSATGTQYYETTNDCSPREYLASSCQDAKNHDASLSDGEYWIYPDFLGGLTEVKIYCHNMMTSPEEYVTLMYNNFAKLHDLSNNLYVGQCQAQNSLPIKTATFSKIRISISNFVVIRTDLTFATVIGIDKASFSRGFGESGDCSGETFRSPCKWHGDCLVNTKGTGFIVDQSVTWKAYGFYPDIFNFSRSTDNTLISFTCGGWSGRCMPETDLILQYNPQQSPIEDTSNVKRVTGT